MRGTLIWLSSLILVLFSASSVHATQGDSLFNAAISEAEQGQFDQAVQLCQEATKALAAEGKLEDWVAAHSFAARCAMRSPTYSLVEVRDQLEDAIASAPMEKKDFRLGRLYLYYGWFLANRLYDFYRAKEAYETTRAIAEQYFNADAAQFVTKTPGKDIYKPLAQIYIRLGESEKAIALMNLAIEQMKKNGQVFDIPELLADWGILHHDLGQDERALSRYREGLKELETAFGGQDLDDRTLDFVKNTRGLLLSSEAQSLLELGDLQQAKQKCLEALNQLTWEDYRAAALSVRGHIAEVEGGPAEAILFFEDAIAQAELYFPFYSRRIAKIENELARLYREQRKWEDALTYAHSALNRVVPGLGKDQWMQVPKPEDFYPENTIMEVLTEKGAIFKAWYDQERQEEHLELAHRHYELAIQMEEVINRVYTYQSSTLSLVAQSQARHEAMMDLVYEGYQRSGDQNHIAEAFLYMEKSRAVALNRALADDRAIRSSGDEALFDREQALQAQLADYQRLLFELRMEKADTHQIASVNRELFLLKEAYDQLIAEFKEKNEAYFQLRHRQQLVSLEELQHSLNEKELFVTYFWGEGSTQLYILAVSKGQPPSLTKNNLPSAFDSDLSEFIRRLKDWNFVLNNEGDHQVFEDFVNQSHLFYQLLLPSYLQADQFSRIIVVPDGQLNLLPFDVLLTSPQKGPVDYAGLNYLIKNSAIQYAFSATIMLDTKGKKLKKGIKNYLGIAPDYTNSQSLSPVANNQQAVENFKKMLRGKALIADGATSEAFLREAGKFRILHFYGHAKAYPSKPLSSWMAFSGNHPGPIASNEPKKENEGLLGGDEVLPEQDLERLLFLFELYKLDLNAELTVLSACETGAGKLALGEGVISLARAFRYAGCSSTLMSLWEANDYQGEVAFLMESFFSHLKRDKMDKDEAIRQAKLSFLEDPKRSGHPAYWASFVLIGDNQPVDFNRPGRLWWVLPIMVVGMLLGRLAGKLRKRSISL